MNKPKTRVLIVGGGFAGVKVALELENNDRFDVTLLSDRSTFHYYPTLYHTATGGARAQSAIPLATLFDGKAVTTKIGKAEKLDRAKKVITTADGKKYPYDVLVLGLGSVPNYFDIRGIDAFSFNVMSPDEARRFKNHLHAQLDDQRKPDLNYVVVGGGPTGIELSGALGKYLKEVMRAHGVKHRAIHIDLVEAAPKLVPRMPDRMSRKIARRLRHLGVRLYLNRRVEGETADALMVDGKPIQSHTVVWNAGTAMNPFFKNNDFMLNERGKVTVDEYLGAGDDIFVLGDNAATEYTGMAQTALHDAIVTADNIERKAEGKPMRPYKPKRPIYVIPVGENWAAVLWGKVQIYGILGWLLRMAADLVAFKDYQPWWRAGRQWLTEFQADEDCLTCVQRSR